MAYNNISCTEQNGSASLLGDGSLVTGSWTQDTSDGYCIFDLGSVQSVLSARVNASTSVSGGAGHSLFIGQDLGSLSGPYHAWPAAYPWESVWMEFSDMPSSDVRYLKLVPIWDPPSYHIYDNEFEVYGSNATATHTTGATQIDGGENFWQWETFTDSKTTPTNTSVTYRYRTSTNGTDWTGWVANIGSVTSRTGDDSNDPTKYRYLQIEATLSNTDGASTPTIDSYSIGYHTNQKPNAPTAMTAVIN